MELVLAAVIAALLIERFVERRDRRVEQDAWRLERVGLLQRIQAPEIAVAQTIAENASDTPAVNPFDDESYWNAVVR